MPDAENDDRFFYMPNLVGKKNYYEKKEFPARGSVICHIATDHGRLTDAMKNDDKVNMQSVSFVNEKLL